MPKRSLLIALLALGQLTGCTTYSAASLGTTLVTGRGIAEWTATNDSKAGWDGRTTSGTIASDGVYYFIMNAKIYKRYSSHTKPTRYRANIPEYLRFLTRWDT